MGGCWSFLSGESFQEEFLEVYGRYATLLVRIKLSQVEAKLLYRYFRDIDVDRSGHITYAELSEHLGVVNSAFTERIFHLFDTDHSGELDFGEFVLAMWNYLTLSRVAFITFIFNLYDMDGSGELDLDEVKNLVREVHGPAMDTNDLVTTAMRSLAGRQTTDRGVQVKRDDFELFVLEHPIILRPAVLLQADMRMATIGTAFWEGLSARRPELAENESMEHFIQIMNRDRVEGFEAIFGGALAEAKDAKATDKAGRRGAKQGDDEGDDEEEEGEGGGQGSRTRRSTMRDVLQEERRKEELASRLQRLHRGPGRAPARAAKVAPDPSPARSIRFRDDA